ncbi:hypothetical protein ACFWXA_34775 [Streptomyces atroolivaceus]|uniref:hypothetical protein n=1 Tax=Streptomyces atroolivaceus TaxID=66869 RepID=UPI003656D556
MKSAVLASYTSMSAEQMKAYWQGSVQGTRVERYASLDALTQIRSDLDRLRMTDDR